MSDPGADGFDLKIAFMFDHNTDAEPERKTTCPRRVKMRDRKLTVELVSGPQAYARALL
jgi:hypothetical protein